MFILTFFLVMSLSQYITNYMLGIDDSSEDAYEYSEKDSLYIGISFLLSIIFEVLSRVQVSFIYNIFKTYYWLIILGYFLAVLILMLTLSELRKRQLLKKREELNSVWQIVRPLITSSKDAEIDYNNPGFELGYKDNSVNKIDIGIEPTKFSGNVDKILTPIVAQLDAFLPTFKWNYDKSHLAERYISFIGDDKPPGMVRWAGSWLRPFRYMPLGVNGKGEVAFTPDSPPKNEMGRSLAIAENGKPYSADLSLPSQPQALVAGSTGGGKAIWVEQEIDK